MVSVLHCFLLSNLHPKWHALCNCAGYERTFPVVNYEVNECGPVYMLVGESAALLWFQGLQAL